MNSVNINSNIRIVKATVNDRKVWRIYLRQQLHSEHITQQAAYRKANTLKLIYK